MKRVTRSRLLMYTSSGPGYMERYNKSLAREAVAEYVKVAEKYGLTPAELALAWCNQQWTVTSSIIGATTLDQLKVRLPPSGQGTTCDKTICIVLNVWTCMLTRAVWASIELYRPGRYLRFLGA